MADDYEAGTELDPEAQAFLDREAPKPTPDYDAEEDTALKAEEPPAKQTEAVTEPPEDEPVQKQAGPSGEIEELARSMGWAPESEWRGDPGKWVDSETFIKRGLGNPAMLLERIKSSEKRHKDTLARVEKMNEQALANQRAQLDAERDRLIEQNAGNPAAIKQINKEHAEAAEQLKPPPVPQETKEWERLEAYQNDNDFRTLAFQICEENKHLSPAEQLKLVDKRLEKRFPEYYAKPAPKPEVPPANTRQMDGVRISGGRKSNYASRLPADVKPLAEKFVKQGLFKSVEDYAKDYFNDN